MADWSELPSDLLAQISLKLAILEDFVVFSAVCRRWNYAYQLIKQERCSKLMPWLMLTEQCNKNDSGSYSYRAVFDPSSERRYLLKLPETFGKRCWGSSDGWVFTVSLDLDMKLFNPLTKVQLPLPPPTSLMARVGGPFNPPVPKEILRIAFIKQTNVVKLRDHRLVVFIVYGYDPWFVSFATPGDSEWTHIELPDTNTLHLNHTRHDHITRARNVGYWNDRLVIISTWGDLSFLEIDNLQHPCKSTLYLHGVRHIIYGAFQAYLIDSFGDLLLVLRYKRVRYSYKTTNFKVYKLQTLLKCWEELYDLGDVALFVGNNSPMAVRASNVLNCDANCIYYTDDEVQFSKLRGKLGGHDMGVFNLKYRSFKTTYHGEDIRSKFCCPLWFVPTL